MKKAIRPAISKWRQTEPELILCAVRWYLRDSLSLRDVEELLGERGLEADHTTIWRLGPALRSRTGTTAGSCSRWLHETEPGRLDPSFSGHFLKVTTHPDDLLACLRL